jgi:hypothetical protein
MNKILLAVKRKPKRFGGALLVGLTSIWAVMEPFVSVYVQDINKYWYLVILLLPSIIIALVRMFPKESIIVKLKHKNSIIQIKFGDIFMQDGNIAIAVNEYFDSIIGKLVSPESMHGYFINKILGGKNELFEQAVKNGLRKHKSVLVQRDEGNKEAYPIGTTIILEFDKKKYLLFALSKTNIKYEAFTTPTMILEALDGLLTKARSECNGTQLNIPLIGTKLSRSGVPPMCIIELILISILKATNESEITKQINIVISKDYFNEIDLSEISRRWN